MRAQIVSRLSRVACATVTMAVAALCLCGAEPGGDWTTEVKVVSVLPSYNRKGGGHQFSEDGLHYACAAKTEDGRWFVVVDGRADPVFDEVVIYGRFFFSPNGTIPSEWIPD